MDSGSNEKRCTFPERIFLYKSGRLYYYFQKSKVDNAIAVGSPSPCLGFLSSGGHSTSARAPVTSALLFLCHKEGEMTWLIGEFREKPGWFFCPDSSHLSLLGADLSSENTHFFHVPIFRKLVQGQALNCRGETRGGGQNRAQKTIQENVSDVQRLMVVTVFAISSPVLCVGTALTDTVRRQPEWPCSSS